MKIDPDIIFDESVATKGFFDWLHSEVLNRAAIYKAILNARDEWKLMGFLQNEIIREDLLYFPLKNEMLTTAAFITSNIS